MPPWCVIRSTASAGSGSRRATPIVPCSGVADAHRCAPQYLIGSPPLSRCWRFWCPTTLAPGVAPPSALRPRLDEGRLWVYLLGLPGVGRPLPARLMRGTGWLISGRALIAAWPTTHQTMTTDTPSIPSGSTGRPPNSPPRWSSPSVPVRYGCCNPLRTNQRNDSSPCGGDVAEPPMSVEGTRRQPLKSAVHLCLTASRGAEGSGTRSGVSERSCYQESWLAETSRLASATCWEALL